MYDLGTDYVWFTVNINAMSIKQIFTTSNTDVKKKQLWYNYANPKPLSVVIDNGNNLVRPDRATFLFPNSLRQVIFGCTDGYIVFFRSGSETLDDAGTAKKLGAWNVS